MVSFFDTDTPAFTSQREECENANFLPLYTTPTERPPLVVEVSVNFLRVEGVAWSAQRIPAAVNLGFYKPEPLLLT
jgi:hypothetical protein